MFVQRFEPQGRRFVDISVIIIIIIIIIIIFITSIKLYTFRPVTYYEYSS